jgi:hypothetical protein
VRVTFEPVPRRAVLFTALLLGAGCVAHLPPGTQVVSSVSPSPSASSSSSPGPCATAAPDSQQIGITLDIAVPTATPSPYGLLAGYGLVIDGNISQVTGTPIELLPSDKVQFVNADPARSLSAVGLPASAITGGAFPTTYEFPSSAALPSGSAIDASGNWSTGLLASDCYSQEFTLPSSGVYYFGDITYYNDDVRDVIVVSASAPQARGRDRRHR